MKWIKKGRIYKPDKNIWWSQNYGILPTPEYFEKDSLIRLYFATTDKFQNGRISYIDVSADNPSNILYIHNNYILDLGEIGCFDDSGVNPSCVLCINKNKYLYYIGYQRCEKVPYMLFPGLATINKDKNNLSRFKKVPIIERSTFSPFSHAAPYVLKDEGIYKMWFWYGKKWINISKKLYIEANIAYAESVDAITWTQKTGNLIRLKKSEFSIGRPWVLKQEGVYKMWYSVRHIKHMYRIGYAESYDGVTWIRKDNEVDITVSKTGWDSEMICYPAVIKVKDKTYMFYNGNGNGKTGFGYAELSN